MIRLLILVCSLLSSFAYSAPKSELWAYWNTSNEANIHAISHLEWQQFLDKYLRLNGQNTLVDYPNVAFEDKQNLKRYLSNLSQIDPRDLNKSEQYAYWVNLYNAATTDLILDNFPIKSITKLGGLFSFGPWGDDIIVINGKSLTLNDIEHRILRPIWNDPRTHYAVNCASLGCPNLQTKAFTANNSEALLTNAAITFINSEKGLSIAGSKTQLSSIYEWFAVDFGGKDKLLEHFSQYRSDLPSELKEVEYQYDWSLNTTR